MSLQREDRRVGVPSGRSGNSPGILGLLEEGGGGQTHPSEDARRVLCVAVNGESPFFVLADGEAKGKKGAFAVPPGEREKIFSLLDWDDERPPYLTTDAEGNLFVLEERRKSDLPYDAVDYQDPFELADQIDRETFGEDAVTVHGRMCHWDEQDLIEDTVACAERCLVGCC